MNRRPLFWQIYPSYLLVTFLVMGALTFFGFHVFEDFYLQQVENDLHSRAELISERVRVVEKGDLDRTVRDLGARSRTRITLISQTGQVLADSLSDRREMDSHLNRPEVRSARDNSIGRSVRYSETEQASQMYLALKGSVLGGEGFVRVSIPVSTIETFLSGVLVRQIYVVLGLLFLFAIVSYGLSTKIARPIEQLKARVRDIAHGDLSGRVELKKGASTELELLGRSINVMAKQLEQRVTHLRKAETMRRDFVANVSHELRTPLTSISGFIETLIDDPEMEKEDRQRFLEIVRRQAGRLSAIVNDLLMLSRIEREEESQETVLVRAPVRPVLRLAVDVVRQRAEAKKIDIELSCPETLHAKIDASLMEQAVVNLVDNAVKYTESAGTVQIRAQQVDEDVEIQVEDQGLGIPKEDLPRIFERFYRVDKARSRKVGGTGLGLSIVKHIALLHKGTAEVQSEMGRGSVFTIRISAE